MAISDELKVKDKKKKKKPKPKSLAVRDLTLQRLRRCLASAQVNMTGKLLPEISEAQSPGQLQKEVYGFFFIVNETMTA